MRAARRLIINGSVELWPWVFVDAPIVAALIGGGVVLIGVLISHQLSAYRDRQNAARSASTAFRAALLSEMRDVYPVAKAWPEDPDAYFRSMFPRLQVAVNAFMPFVPKHRRSAFLRAWLSFYSAYACEGEQCYHHYLDFHDSPDAKSTLRANVDRLLAFAEQS